MPQEAAPSDDLAGTPLAMPLGPTSPALASPAVRPVARSSSEGESGIGGEEVRKGGQRGGPWRWVPSLYFLQALPNTLVVGVFPVALKSLGLDNLTITSWLPLVSLPWTLKLLWAPVVDLTGTKRAWTLSMQAACAMLMALAALVLLTPSPLALCLLTLALLAVAAATQDIAADGLYLSVLARPDQARYSGIIATASRLGRLYCNGAIVFVAGYITAKLGYPKPTAWCVAVLTAAALYFVGAAYHLLALPATPAASARGSARVLPTLLRTLVVLFAGLCVYLVLAGGVRWTGNFVGGRFGIAAWVQNPAALQVWLTLGGAAAVLLAPAVLLTRRLLRNTDIGTALASYVRQPGFGAILYFILTYRLGEAMLGAIAPLFLLDPLARGGAGQTEAAIGTINGFAGTTGIIVGGIAGGLFVHRIGLRRAFWPMALAMHTPNLLYVLTAYLISHHPPGSTVVQLATGLPFLSLVTFVDQFGYGFGFAGYFVYLMHVAQRTHGGAFRTTHYAIGTGLGALTILLATILSGILQSAVGYYYFFIAVCVLTLPGLLALKLIPHDPPPPGAIPHAD